MSETLNNHIPHLYKSKFLEKKRENLSCSKMSVGHQLVWNPPGRSLGSYYPLPHPTTSLTRPFAMFTALVCRIWCSMPVKLSACRATIRLGSDRPVATVRSRELLAKLEDHDPRWDCIWRSSLKMIFMIFQSISTFYYHHQLISIQIRALMRENLSSGFLI